MAALVVAGAVSLFLAGRLTARTTSARFEPITFRRGSVASAKFAPDGRTIIYAAAFEGGPTELYSTQPGGPESRPLGLEARINSVSSRGELAVLLDRPGREPVLARVPIGGGAPRPVLENVRSADWGPDGESLAVVRTSGERDTLEFPIGRVLYRGHGWLSGVAVSPKGDYVAFFEHPIPVDSRGDVVVVDLSGKKTTISSGWESLGGSHWSPGGDEVWFSAAGGAGKAGLDYALFAGTLAGRVRTLANAPGSLNLQDITPDGRVLLVHGTARPSIMALAPGTTEERELTWLDFSWVMDISRDGRTNQFNEQGGGGGPGYAVYLRGTDRSPAIRLGKGVPHSLSPDGRSALALDLATNTLMIMPTGPGESRVVPQHGINTYSWAGWFPDATRILFTGAEPAKGLRMYVQDLTGGAPRPVTPEGVSERANTLTPDGKWVVARSKDVLARFPVEGGEPQTVKGGQSDDTPLSWRDDGRVLFVRQGRLPARIYALEVETGQRTLIREIAPRDPLGVGDVYDIRLTPDGKAYAYVFIRTISSLYQVTGLH